MAPVPAIVPFSEKRSFIWPYRQLVFCSLVVSYFICYSYMRSLTFSSSAVGL